MSVTCVFIFYFIDILTGLYVCELAYTCLTAYTQLLTDNNVILHKALPLL